jgi:hypothetical protein
MTDLSEVDAAEPLLDGFRPQLPNIPGYGATAPRYAGLSPADRSAGRLGRSRSAKQAGETCGHVGRAEEHGAVKH